MAFTRVFVPRICVINYIFNYNAFEIKLTIFVHYIHYIQTNESSKSVVVVGISRRAELTPNLLSSTIITTTDTNTTFLSSYPNQILNQIIKKHHNIKILWMNHMPCYIHQHHHFL